jgi:hypothetical protein
VLRVRLCAWSRLVSGHYFILLLQLLFLSNLDDISHFGHDLLDNIIIGLFFSVYFIQGALLAGVLSGFNLEKVRLLSTVKTRIR